jgi:putative acetyltransferase
MNPTIHRSTDPKELPTIRLLFQEYADSLGIDLGFQNFAEELAGLPGPYAPPRGCILLAKVDGQPAGCVALKPLGDGISEMKRLYIRSQSRGHGLGRLLAEYIIQEARDLGYDRIRLDTIPSLMGSAVRLYRELGFESIPAYCENPFPDALYLERHLQGGMGISKEKLLMGRFVIVAYGPKPGMSESLMSAVREHLRVLRDEDLVSDRPAYVMRAKDGTILEVFEWKSAEAIAKAHSSPAVQALWAEFAAACDYRPLSSLTECQQLFAEFDAVDLE